MSSSQFQCHRDVINDTKVRIGAATSRTACPATRRHGRQTTAATLAEGNSTKSLQAPASLQPDALRRRHGDAPWRWRLQKGARPLFSGSEPKFGPGITLE